MAELEPTKGGVAILKKGTHMPAVPSSHGYHCSYPLSGLLKQGHSWSNWVWGIVFLFIFVLMENLFTSLLYNIRFQSHEGDIIPSALTKLTTLTMPGISFRIAHWYWQRGLRITNGLRQYLLFLERPSKLPLNDSASRQLPCIELTVVLLFSKP